MSHNSGAMGVAPESTHTGLAKPSSSIIKYVAGWLSKSASPALSSLSFFTHLPIQPEVQHVTHLYHTADPIAMGTCNGVLSSCALGGYAMESKCHLGRSIV